MVTRAAGTAEEGRPGRSSEAPFIGRSKELGAVVRALRAARLVTIVGPPGIGKTRLAREAQRALPQRRGAGRLVFCDLAPVAGADPLAHAVAAALGVRVEASPREAIARVLRMRPRTWLLLDNFEHLVPHAAESLGHWLVACPETRWLVTSRVALGLPEEHTLGLGPLSLPARARGPVRSDAVRLFLASLPEGATARGPSELSCAARIALRLEGNPLALRIAAAHVAKDRTLAEVADDVERGALGAWGASPEDRHSTLERAIQGSFGLLDDEEARLLGRLSIFRGAFSLEAASAVSGLAVPAARRALEALVRKSVVEVSPDSAGAHVLLVSIREHAARRLSPEERGALEEAHACHFAERAFAWSSSSPEGGYRARFSALRAALPDIEAAFRRELGRGTPASAERVVRLSLGLDAWMLANGPLGVRAELLDRVAEATRLLPPSPLLAEWHCAYALALDAQGRAEEERVAAERAAALAELVQSTHALGRSGLALGIWSGTHGVAEDAFLPLRAARAHLALAGDRDGLAHTWLLEGTIHYSRGAIESALATSIEALRALEGEEPERAGTPPSRLLGTAFAHRGLYEHFQGQCEAALVSLEKACHIDERTGQTRLLLHARWSLAALLHDLGRLDEALALLRLCERETTEMDDARVGAFVAGTMAQLFEERGQLGLAEAEHERAVALARRAGFVWATHPIALLGRAGFRAELGRAAEARDDLAEGARHWARCRGQSIPGDLRAAEDAIVRLTAARVAHFADGARAEAEEVLAREWALGRTEAGFCRGFEGTGYALRRLHAAVTGSRRGADPAGLRLLPEARAVVLPGGRLVDLRRREIPWRVLQHLVEARGRVTKIADLAAAVWPGERFVEKAERVRLRSAVYALRAAGLREWLLQEGDGYRLADGPTGNRG